MLYQLGRTAIRQSLIYVVLPIIGITIILPGCSNNGRQALSGSVTLDGQPVSGSISFDPIAGTSGITSGGAIRDGKFSLEKSVGLPPGKYAVSIKTSRKTGRIINDYGLRVEEMLPVSFLEEDSLEAVIEGGGDNYFEYKLTSKK